MQELTAKPATRLICLPAHEPQGRARHSVRAVGNNPNAPVDNRGAQRTDAPYLNKQVQGFKFADNSRWA